MTIWLRRPKSLSRTATWSGFVSGDVEVIAEVTRIGNELVFDRLSIDGGDPAPSGLQRYAYWHGNLRELKVLRAFASAVPREIVIQV